MLGIRPDEVCSCNGSLSLSPSSHFVAVRSNTCESSSESKRDLIRDPSFAERVTQIGSLQIRGFRTVNDSREENLNRSNEGEVLEEELGKVNREETRDFLEIREKSISSDTKRGQRTPQTHLIRTTQITALLI